MGIEETFLNSFLRKNVPVSFVIKQGLIIFQILQIGIHYAPFHPYLTRQE